MALREMTGGGTIVIEAGTSQTGGATTVHLEGYVTGRGPGWKGKEYDLIPKNLAVAGILRSLIVRGKGEPPLRLRPTDLATVDYAP